MKGKQSIRVANEFARIQVRLLFLPSHNHAPEVDCQILSPGHIGGIPSRSDPLNSFDETHANTPRRTPFGHSAKSVTARRQQMRQPGCAGVVSKSEFRVAERMKRRRCNPASQEKSRRDFPAALSASLQLVAVRLRVPDLRADNGP
jgi:hypothetical protein